MLDWLLAQGSVALLFLALIGGGMGLPLSEDLVLLAAGALMESGLASWWLVVPVCMAGVFLGDQILFFLARRLGRAALARPPLRRLLPPPRQERLHDALRRRAGFVIVLARQIPGLRSPIFVASAALGLPQRRFACWDALALCVSAPLMMSLGYFGAAHLEEILAFFARVKQLVLVLLLASVTVGLLWRAQRQRGRRRQGR
jgi:membrane protein DedA with SNARE-associated domain